MATNIIMPVLGMAQETGTILRWLKQVGEQVEQGEPLLEIETDKAVAELEAPASGVLARIDAQDGEEVPVTQVIGIILEPGESLDDVAPPSEKKEAEKPPVVEKETQKVETQAAMPKAGKKDEKVLASPLAKRLAKENQIDLKDVPHSGKRIEKADVLNYLESRKQEKSIQEQAASMRILASPKAKRLMRERGITKEDIIASGLAGKILTAKMIENIKIPSARKAEAVGQLQKPAGAKGGEVAVPMSTTWQIMAERTTQTWTSAPHFYLIREINATRLFDWRQSAQKQSEAKVTFTDLLVKAVALSLKKHPRVNGTWRDGQVFQIEDINIGVAVATDAGLVVPVIHHADTLSVSEIAAARVALIERAREGTLRLSDISDCTFTVTNLGMFGIDMFQAVLNGDQAAILAVGKIADKVVAVDGQPVVQPRMVMSLSCDHRVIDGAMGALFLQTLSEILEEPLTLIN